jgi:hypothetical protein
MTRLIALVLGMALLAGCAVTAPATMPTPDDYQGLADWAVAKLAKYRGRAVIQPHGGDSFGHYYCNGSRITLGTAGNTTWLLAHELGHHLNGHCDNGEMLSHEIDHQGAAGLGLGRTDRGVGDRAPSARAPAGPGRSPAHRPQLLRRDHGGGQGVSAVFLRSAGALFMTPSSSCDGGAEPKWSAWRWSAVAPCSSSSA